MSSPAPSAGNRFATIDADHNGGILWIAVSLSFTYFVLSCIVRVSMSFGQYTKDTISLVVATAFGFVYAVVVFSQLDYGFGTSLHLLSARDTIMIQKLGYAAELLFIATLTITKVSVFWFLTRLSPNVRYQQLTNGMTIFCVIWGIGSTFTLAIRCNIAEPWNIVSDSCASLIPRWEVITSLDTFTELMVIVLTIVLVFNLQMSFKKKFLVVFGFAFRIPLIVLAALRLHYTRRYASSTNATFDQVTPSVIMAVQLSWSLISATIPCLKSFVVTLSSGYLGTTLNNADSTYYHSSRRNATYGSGKGEIYALEDVKAAQPQNIIISSVPESAPRVSDDGSQDFIIRKTVELRVDYNN